MRFTLYKDNDNLVSVVGLTNVAGDAYVNDATVTLVSLTDSGGDEVSGVSWPLTLSYVSGSDGNYRGVIDAAAELTAGATYTGTVTATSGTLDAQWTLRAVCKERKA